MKRNRNLSLKNSKQMLFAVFMVFVLFSCSKKKVSLEVNSEIHPTTLKKPYESGRSSKDGEVPVLEKQIGTEVTITGEVSRSKIPYVKGIRVDSAENFRGKCIVATGTLVKNEVTQKKLDEMNSNGIVQNSGIGTFYYLENTKIELCSAEQ